MTKAGRTGPLLIIGGAEDKKDEAVILREFVRLAKGARARIVVVTVATELPDEVGAEYSEVFKRLEVADVQVVHVRNREEASLPESIEAIQKATGIFFTGGSQLRITSLIGGTEFDKSVLHRYQNGAVIAGTSSGASMMAGTMIIGGESETNPSLGGVQLMPGMSLLPDVIIDQHFAQRGRIGRLVAAVANNPAYLGLGIDENTAVIVQNNCLEVIGAGSISILDGSTISHTNLPEIGHDDCIAVCGMQFHILPAGYRYDLAARQCYFESMDDASAKERKR